MTVGLQQVELLGLSGARPTAISLTAPWGDRCRGFPVAVCPGDVTDDWLADVLVFDPTCGNWVARADADGTFRSLPWAAVLPEVPPNYLLEVDDWNGDGRNEIVSGNALFVELLSRWEADWRRSSIAVPPPNLSTLSATQLFAHVPGIGILFQRGEFFSRFQLGPPSLTLAEVMLRQKPSGPYLRPFHGFDHLAVARLPDCRPFGLGVGLFRPAGGPETPRRLQALHFGEQSFETRELSELQATTFGFVVREGSKDALVAAFGKDGGGRDVLRTLRVFDCGHAVEQLAEHPIEFAWRAVDSPSGYRDRRLPRTNGVKIVGFRREPGVSRFAHYDGFDVRVFDVDDAGGVVQTRTRIHEQRLDLAW